MTISNTVRKAGPYSGNGITTAFPFSFKVFAAADVLVVLTNTATGVETTQTLTSQYTVSLNPNQDSNPGGTVTMLAAPAAGFTVTIGSQIAYSQPMVLTNTGGFYPTVINDAMDRATALIQQLLERSARALSLPFSAASGVSTSLPAPVANNLIAWDGTGSGFQNVNPATIVSIATYGSTVADLFSGNSVQTAFTLSGNPAVIANLDVSVGGVVQRPGIDYTWSGSTLTFTSPPPAGVQNILVRYGTSLPGGTATSATTAVNLSGGATGQIPYQASSGTTAFVGPGTAGQFLQSQGPGQPPVFVTLPSGVISRVARTSNTALQASDSGKLIDITSGTFTQTFSSCASLGDGWWCYVRNSGTGDITLDPNASETIDGLTTFVMYPGEMRLIQCDGATLRSVMIRPGSRVFTSSGTFVAPPGASGFIAEVIGGGGGGGGGNNGVAGGGGGGGARARLPSIPIPGGTSVSITVASGGSGGPTDTDGGDGGTSQFGTYGSAFGGAGGNRGGTGGLGGGGGGTGSVGGASGTRTNGGRPRESDGFGGVGGGGGSGNSAQNRSAEWGGAGGGSGSAAGSQNGGSSLYGGGAGGGGGQSSPSPGLGGRSGTITAGGGGSAGSVSAGGAGPNGDPVAGTCGGGGGGGWGQFSGGAGGTAGGGGGGGGSDGAGNFGSGGPGGRGEVRIWWY